MHISLRELFLYRQYISHPVCYCFDRKTYTICDVTLLECQQTTPYVRYIPLFRIDEEQIQQNYIQRFMGKNAWSKYKESMLCFNEFMQKNSEWDSWWRFYKGAVYEIARQWCSNNHISILEE